MLVSLASSVVAKVNQPAKSPFSRGVVIGGIRPGEVRGAGGCFGTTCLASMRCEKCSRERRVVVDLGVFEVLGFFLCLWISLASRPLISSRDPLTLSRNSGS